MTTTKKNKYAGIGARGTPPHIMEVEFELGKILAKEGWVLRSGRAAGSDMAFEDGCLKGKGEMEIYLPYPKFNGAPKDDPRYIANITNEMQALASTVVPHWGNCNGAARKFHSRNCCQILGRDLDDPVNMVLCWTINGDVVGGTATGIRLAQRMAIPVFNLGFKSWANYEHPRKAADEIMEWVNKL